MSTAKRGLGRGLNALFEDEEVGFDLPAQNNATDNSAARGRTTLGVDQMEPSRFQPRKIFDNAALDELAESIKSHGLLQPVLVRESHEEPGKYEIIAGERRWRAAQRAQLHDVPVIIKEMSDIEALEIALIENLQREDLNPVDEAMGYKRLLEEHGYTQEQLAGQLGKSRSYIANMVRLLGLPDVVLVHLERGDLSIGHARALITSDNAEALARQVVRDGLSVRETEALTQDAAVEGGKSGSARTSAPKGKDVDTTALEKEMSAQLGMKLTIDSRNGQSGAVRIEFKTLDQLDEVLKRLSR